MIMDGVKSDAPLSFGGLLRTEYTPFLYGCLYHRNPYLMIKGLRVKLSSPTSVSNFSRLDNVLRLCEETDFGAQNCQYTTNVDAR